MRRVKLSLQRWNGFAGVRHQWVGCLFGSHEKELLRPAQWSCGGESRSPLSVTCQRDALIVAVLLRARTAAVNSRMQNLSDTASNRCVCVCVCKREHGLSRWAWRLRDGLPSVALYLATPTLGMGFRSRSMDAVTLRNDSALCKGRGRACRGWARGRALRFRRI